MVNNQSPPPKATTLSKLRDMLGHWLDSDYKRIENPKELEEKVDWERCIPFIILHLGLVCYYRILSQIFFTSHV